MFNVSIPEISEEDLMKRYKKVKPLKEVGGKLYNIRPLNLFELYQKVPLSEFTLEGPGVNSEYQTYFDFACICKIETKVVGGRKECVAIPSIAEILAQIPESAFDEAVAFRIYSEPKLFGLSRVEHVLRDQGYCVATIRLYKPNYLSSME